MAALIERLLSKDREQRPQTAKAVADELAAVEREATQPTPDERTIQMNRAASVSERSAHTAPSRSRLRWLVAASLLVLLGGVAAAIVVIIRDKQGREVARFNVPDKGSVQIQDNGKGEEKKATAPKVENPIAAAPLPPLLPASRCRR